MKNKKQKILILSDLKESTSSILKSTVSIAKMINCEVEFFHVKKATDVVERESQLSAVRNIKDKYLEIDKAIQNVLQPINQSYNVNIKYSIAFGNVKALIDNYISKHKPDIIVMGKRKSIALKLNRDSITNFVLNKYKGSVLLFSDIIQLEPNKPLSLGLLNNSENRIPNEFTHSLMNYSQKPLKSFSVVKNSKKESRSVASDYKTVEYVFEAGDNSISNLSNYISRNKVNLLCLDRSINKSESNELNLNEIINKLNVSLLLTAN